MGAGHVDMRKFPTVIVFAFVLGLVFLVVALCSFLPALRPHNCVDWLVAITLLIFFFGVGGADVWQIRRITKYVRDKHPDTLNRLGIINVRRAGFARSTSNSLGLHDPVLDAMFASKRRFDRIACLMLIVIFGGLLLIHKATI